MADTPVLETKIREERRRRQVTRLREQGYLPGVVYGHQEEPLCVAVETEELERIVREGERVVELKTDGKIEIVQIFDLQWDFLGKDLLHVDFKRVGKHEKVEVGVPIELRGNAPGTTHGGMLEQPLTVLNVECLATNAPTSIVLNINELELGQQILVKDVEFPEGAVPLDDPETVVLQVVAPVEEEEEEEEGALAEPELIRREEEEEEEEGAE